MEHVLDLCVYVLSNQTNKTFPEIEDIYRFGPCVCVCLHWDEVEVAVKLS